MKVELGVFLADDTTHVGDLVYAKDGARESCQFQYTDAWRNSPDSFDLCPQLKRVPGFQAKSGKDSRSVFFDCFADSAPNGWGKKLILRDHAHQRRERENDALPSELTSLDFLLWVDDFSRQGALRFRDKAGVFCRETPEDRRKAPPVLSFRQLLASSQAVELNHETKQDLAFLRGRGSDLDGMRPKCTVVDTDGTLCLAKFPSIEDTRSVPLAEILAVKLAGDSKIRVQDARLVNSDGVPVVLIKRFDREKMQRKMYLSAASMLEDFDGQDDHSYTEIADLIRKYGAHVERDIEELWRRMVFNILIKNVDDHLHNHGFLHVKRGQWELAPAFDINPFPEKQHVLKLWISEDSGVSGSIEHAIEAIGRFGISPVRAKSILEEVLAGTRAWKETASALGMSRQDIEAISGAFVHPERTAAEQAALNTVFGPGVIPRATTAKSQKQGEKPHFSPPGERKSTKKLSG